MWYDSFMWDSTHLCVTLIIHVWHDSSICVIWLIHMRHDSFICDMTHPYLTWLIHMWHDSFICDMTHSYVSWLIHMWHDSCTWDMTHSYVTWLMHVWHHSFICDMNSFIPHDSSIHTFLLMFFSRQKKQWHRANMVSTSSFPIYTSALIYLSPSYFFFLTQIWEAPPWKRPTINLTSKEYTAHQMSPIFCVCDMTHSFLWRDSFMCDMAHSFAWHGSLTCDMTHSFVTWPIYMWHDSFMCDMTH